MSRQATVAANPYAAPQAHVEDAGQHSKAEPLSWSQVLFSFQGRIPRKAFWLYGQLPILVGAFVMGFISAVAHMRGILLIAQLAMIWPALAVSVKRWHDHDMSGWWQLLAIVPIVNLYVLAKLCFMRGTDGDNRFGGDATGQY
jgi:uncharacterized membrane protein YhaH (DUF805 family)